jgi:hypothetical protein
MRLTGGVPGGRGRWRAVRRVHLGLAACQLLGLSLPTLRLLERRLPLCQLLSLLPCHHLGLSLQPLLERLTVHARLLLGLPPGLLEDAPPLLLSHATRLLLGTPPCLVDHPLMHLYLGLTERERERERRATHV